MSDIVDNTAPKQLAPYCWQPGQSGNPAGRPKSARNELCEGFVKALNDDFVLHGIAAIEAMRREKPAEYNKMIAGLLSKDLQVSGGEGGPIVLTWLKAQA